MRPFTTMMIRLINVFIQKYKIYKKGRENKAKNYAIQRRK